MFQRNMPFINAGSYQHGMSAQSSAIFPRVDSSNGIQC